MGKRSYSGCLAKRYKRRKAMKAILIDPKEQTVTEVVYTGEYTHIHDLICAPIFDCVRLGQQGPKRQHEVMYIDDEGLYREEQHYFKLCGNGPFTNKALIVGSNIDGADQDTCLTADLV